jgi:hypothetical protein
LVDGAADRGSGGIHPALGQSQQRQSRLRHPTSLVGFVIGVLGLGELSPEPVELGPLVERRTELGLRGTDSRWQARRASSKASGHAPCSCMISDRCTMHRPR